MKNAEKEVKTSYLLPRDQVNFAARVRMVNAVWTDVYPNSQFEFIGKNDFSTLVTDFLTAIDGKKLLLTQRKETTNTLKDLLKEGKKQLSALKKYISLQHEGMDKATAYSLYGLVTVDKKGYYSFPVDKDNFLAALKILLNKLSEPNNAIATQKYGLAYWQDFQSRLTVAWDKAQTMDSDLSQYTATIQTLFPRLKEIVGSIRLVLKANNPSTYKNVWREWGFQTEKN